MKDSFKDFISDRRNEFEREAGEVDAIWQNIDKRISQVERKKRWSVVWKVAAVVAFLALSLSLVHVSTRTKLPGELQEVEAYYSALIDSRMNELKVYETSISSAMLSDLNEIDSTYEGLKKDLLDGADNEEVINAMIQSYRLKLEVLEKILEEMGAERQDNDDNEISI